MEFTYHQFVAMRRDGTAQQFPKYSGETAHARISDNYTGWTS